MVLTPNYKHGGVLILEADREAGDRFDIIAAVTESGACPFWDEFFLPLNRRYNDSLKRNLSMNKKDGINYRTLDAYLQRFCQNGPWSNKHQLRSIENGFFEFKCIETGLRVIFYYDGINQGVVVLTHYFDKGGRDKTPLKEKTRMYQIRESFERSRGMRDR